MYNFLHKPCCPDGTQGKMIAQRMKKKALNTKANMLEFLLSKRLDTSLIEKMNISEIADFPKLNRKTLIEKIFLGTFHLKQSKSYIVDLIKNGFAYKVSCKLIKNIQNKSLRNELLTKKSVIIACEIPSRHKRSKIKNIDNDTQFRMTYKVFIQYIPYSNSSKSIKGKSNCLFKSV